MSQTLGLDALENTHVVLVQPFARRQMPQRVRSQIDAIKVSHRHLLSFVALIMGGSFVPVAVCGKALVVGQL
jgi:hypothetical protein